MKAGDRVVITKCPDNYDYFSIGDEAVLTRRDLGGDWWAVFCRKELCIQNVFSECKLVATATTECDALREENEMLAAENRRLMNEVNGLRKVPAYPEAAVKAVWEHGVRIGGLSEGRCAWSRYRDDIPSIFTEALQKGE